MFAPVVSAILDGRMALSTRWVYPDGWDFQFGRPQSRSGEQTPVTDGVVLTAPLVDPTPQFLFSGLTDIVEVIQ